MDDELRELIELIGEVPAAKFGYGIRDDHGRTMDTLKVIESPAGGYLAAYHVGTGRGYEVHLATSEDLMTWRHRALLDAPASQPTIAATSDGGFLVVVEAGGDGRPAWLRFKYYPVESCWQHWRSRPFHVARAAAYGDRRPIGQAPVGVMAHLP